MIERVAEILKPDASFLFTAPLETGSWTDQNTGHECVSLGQDTYLDALNQAGFELVGYHQDSGQNNYYEAKRK